MDRRTFLQGTLAGAATLAIPHHAAAADPDLSPIWTQIEKHHDEAVQRLQEWIKQPSIAAENRGVNEGCDLTMRFLREAGIVPGMRVLDVGSGAGDVTFLAAELVGATGEVVGVDLAPAAIEVARSRAQINATKAPVEAVS